MVSGKNSEVVDELEAALGGGASKPQKAPRKAPGVEKGVAKPARKPRGPCRPYRKFPQVRLAVFAAALLYLPCVGTTR